MAVSPTCTHEATSTATVDRFNVSFEILTPVMLADGKPFQLLYTITTALKGDADE